MKTVINSDYKWVRRISELLANENVIKVLRTLDFAFTNTEDSIVEKSGLPKETVVPILFELLKLDFCTCAFDDKYAFGGRAYILFTVMSGMYLSTDEGSKDIYSISRSINSNIRSVEDVLNANK